MRAALVLLLLAGCGLSSGGGLSTGGLTGTVPVAKGGTNLTASSDDNVMVGNGTTWQSKAVADCDSATSALNYDVTTNAFSCRSISAGTTIYTGSATGTNFTNITAGTCATAVTATVTGAILPASTNANPQPLCSVGQSSDNVGLNVGYFCKCWVTANDQISFTCCNMRATDFDPNFEYYTFYVQNAP